MQHISSPKKEMKQDEVVRITERNAEAEMLKNRIKGVEEGWVMSTEEVKKQVFADETKKSKIAVYDKPKQIKQRFRVSMPGKEGMITVIRTELVRSLDQMGCTDGLPEGHIDRRVSYEVFKEVSMKARQEAIQAVEAEVEKQENI